MTFYLLEHMKNEKYVNQLDPSQNFQFSTHIIEKGLGFIKVMFGR